jgi:hypothetical protein
MTANKFAIPSASDFAAALSSASSVEEVDAILTELKGLRNDAKAILSTFRNPAAVRSAGPVQSANTELIRRTALANGRKNELSRTG